MAVAPVVPAARGGDGPTAAAEPGPHKEETPPLVSPQPPSPGPAQRSRGRPRWDPGGSATRKKHFLPGPPPRTNSRVFEAADPEGFLPHSELRTQLPPVLPQAAVRSAAACASLLLSWDEAPRPPESLGLVRPRPWPRLSLVGPQRQSSSIAPPLELSALPVGPEHSSFLGPAPSPAHCPFLWSPPLLWFTAPPPSPTSARVRVATNPSQKLRTQG